MKGTLPIGIEYDGQIHRDFEVRPRKVSDSIEASADPDVSGDDSLLGLGILSRQIVSIGSIPKEQITWKLLYDSWEDDLKEIDSKTKEAAVALRTFSGDGKGGQKADSGADETGVHKD
jgi:phage FluMu protein gp41